jgi:hypothetical protein
MKKALATMKKATTRVKQRQRGSTEQDADAASHLIDARIKELRDWRGETLARIRLLIKQADPDVVEEWKWRGVPVWSDAGIICTGETYKTVEDDFCQRRRGAGSFRPLQRQPGRQHQACHRFS